MLTLPALNSFSSAGFDSAVSNLDGVLQQARSFAMARNSYVYVGLTEVDATKTTPMAGIGASSSPPSPPTTAPALRQQFQLLAHLDQLQQWLRILRCRAHPLLSNVHLADLGTPPATGGMARPTVSAGYRLGNAACVSVTPFAWPLGTALGAGPYNFTMVIQYSPQGTANVVLSGSGGSIPQQIEIGLQPTHGNVLHQRARRTTPPFKSVASPARTTSIVRKVILQK